VSQKNKALQYCPKLRQMFTDFQIFFTDRFTSKYPTTLEECRWTTMWNIRIGK